jgi:hypothetical protein
LQQLLLVRRAQDERKVIRIVIGAGTGSIAQLVTAEALPSIVVDRRDCEMNCSSGITEAIR